MAFQAIPKGIKVAIEADLGGEACVNTLGFRWTGTGEPDFDTMVEVAGIIGSWWTTMALPILPIAYKIVQIVAEGLAAPDSPIFADTLFAGLSGDQSGVLHANNISLAIGFKSGLRGRANNGRNFWASFCGTQVANSRVGATWIDQILDVYRFLLDPGELAGQTVWAVMSRKDDGVTTNGRMVDIKSVVVTDDVVDSMGRRLPKRGV